MDLLESSLFDWLTWRGGCVTDILGLTLRCREADITSIEGKRRILAYAVGWCPAEKIPCRPKVGHIAVMFWVNNRYFWFHLRSKEWFKVIQDQK